MSGATDAAASGPSVRYRPAKALVFLGAVLLCAATLNTWGFVHSPGPYAGVQGMPGFEPTLIALEILLGLWLISGASPSPARRLAIGCFSVFACYTLYEALAGKTDCGCFGQVHVSPWFTFALDVAAVLVLVFLAKPPATLSRWSKRKWPVAAALGIGLAAGIGTAALHPKPAMAANGLATADSGKLVILEPHKWPGHRLPVLGDIVPIGASRPRAAGLRAMSLGQRLATGNWIIMFYHASCDECRATIPVYEQLAQQETLSGKRAHVAFIRVPSGSGASTRGLFHSDLPLHATLDAGHQWFATTPIVVELHDGVVTRAVSGDAAMNLNWRHTMIDDHGSRINDQ